MLRKRDADILVCLAGILAFTLVYVWNPPGPKYFPIEGVWQFAPIEGSPGMSWYARFAYSMAACMISGLAVWPIGRYFGGSEKALDKKAVYALTTMLAIALVCAFAFITWHELSVLSES